MESLRKILVVDDDPVIRRVLRERLVSAGFQVLEAADGAPGIALAKQERPVLILLDIMMPGQGGIETYHALRQEPATRDIPVIFLSALAQGLVSFKDLEKNFEVVAKPYDPEKLMRIIQKVLGEPARENQGRLEK